MHFLFLLFFFIHEAASAACLPSAPPHTLDIASAKMIYQVQQALKISGEAPVCNQDLRKKQQQLRDWLGYFRQNSESAGRLESAWLERLFKRKIRVDANEDEACAFDRDLAEAENFYSRFEARYEDIDETLSEVARTMLMVRAEMEILKSPEKALELLHCHEQFIRTSHEGEESEGDSGETCLAQTNASLELWDAVDSLEKNPGGVAAGLSCLLDKNSRPAAEKNLELAEGVESGALNLLKIFVGYLEELEKTAPSHLAKIREIRKDLTSWNCGSWQKSERLKVESSMHKLFAGEDWGSGFVLRGPKGKPELLTARHVSYSGESLKSAMIKLGDKNAGKQPRQGTAFEIAPGFYDRGRDLIKRELASAPSALTAAGEKKIAAAGEKVVISGYPSSRDGEFTQHGCEVKGIGRHIFLTELAESYLLHCPGAEAHIGGMSGGPVTNAQGEVIAVISAHNSLTNIVIAQPISRAPNGENRFGFRKVFHYQNCFEEGDIIKPKPCQVIPGLTYEKSVP